MAYIDLSPSFVIGQRALADGDAIQLSISNDITFQSGINPISGMPRYTTITQNNYINSNYYANLNPTLTQTAPVWKFVDHTVNGVGQISDVPVTYGPGNKMDKNPSQIANTSGANFSRTDVIASPTTATVSRYYNSSNGASEPSQAGINQVAPPDNTTTVTALDPVATSVNPTLYVEIHGKFIALRGANGMYLHLLPRSVVTTLSGTNFQDTAYPGTGTNAQEVPGDYVLTFRDIPSNNWSAQYSLYGIPNSTQVLLVNRATNYVVTLENNMTTQTLTQYQYKGYAPYNYCFRIAATWYDNATTQGCTVIDTYTQYICRLSGSTKLADALNNPSNCAFTLQITTTGNCDPLNPTAACSANTAANIAAFNNLCQSGDLYSTARCQNWALTTGKDNALGTVLKYAQRTPNDITFASCFNSWPVRELIDFFGMMSPPVVLQPLCSYGYCGTQGYKTVNIAGESCVTQICSTNLTILGSINNSDVSVKNVCSNSVDIIKNGSNTDTTGSGGTTTPTTPAVDTNTIFTDLLALYNSAKSFGTDTLTHINVVTVVSSILISFLIVMVIMFIFPMNIGAVLVNTIILTCITFLTFYNN